jgi:hypothetical protein
MTTSDRRVQIQPVPGDACLKMRELKSASLFILEKEKGGG